MLTGLSGRRLGSHWEKHTESEPHPAAGNKSYQLRITQSLIALILRPVDALNSGPWACSCVSPSSNTSALKSQGCA